MSKEIYTRPGSSKKTSSRLHSPGFSFFLQPTFRREARGLGVDTGAHLVGVGVGVKARAKAPDTTWHEARLDGLGPAKAPRLAGRRRDLHARAPTDVHYCRNILLRALLYDTSPIKRAFVRGSMPGRGGAFGCGEGGARRVFAQTILQQ